MNTKVINVTNNVPRKKSEFQSSFLCIMRQYVNIALMHKVCSNVLIFYLAAFSTAYKIAQGDRDATFASLMGFSNSKFQ